MRKLNYVFLFFLILIFILGYIYFFQISPVIEKKIDFQVIEKTNYNNMGNEELDIIIKLLYFLYKLDLYKLHDNFLNKEKPLILIELIDDNLYNNNSNIITENNNFYAFSVVNNNIIFLDKENYPSYYNFKENFNYDNNVSKLFDLEIIFKKDFLYGDIKKFDDFNYIISNIKQGNIIFNILTDEKNLVLKGYKVLYDKFSSKFSEFDEKNLNNKITGNFFNFTNKSLKTFKIFELILLLFFSFFVGILIEKEK